LRRQSAIAGSARAVVLGFTPRGTSGGKSFFFALACATLSQQELPAPASFLCEAARMSGHSKWATIKHKKAATDARRGKVFTKIIREIMIAARSGGADPNSNPRLRTAILAAKNENMPNDNIERAILRGSGQMEGETLEEVTFEGYGPGGVGMLVQVVTSNRNRIVSEIRHLMSKHGGNMAENGAVGWMFHRKGDITIPKEAADEEKMMGIVLDAGAEDLKDDGSSWEVVTPPEAFEKVREALTAAGINPASAEVGWVPQNYIKLTGAQAQQMVKMVEALEEHDDVQHVYANFDIDEKEIQAAVAS
jgi:YebC/PmpR family DNA-binding regulatory protein